MAEGWTTQVAAAAGVAAATGAAQLGLGYGLGVVAWPVTETADDSVWLGSLGWATWIAASSTVFGAVIASRFQARTGGPWRFALAASAAVGALLPVALIALPARAAVRPDTFSPETIAGGYAAVGILLGLVIAYWAVVSRPVSANLVATATWLWASAVAAILVQLTMHRASATYLTSWQFADPGNPFRYGTIYWPSALLTLLAALLIGAIGAWPAVRRGELGIGAAASGAVGPLLVAAAFLVLAPQLTGALGPLESAYLIAPYAVLAGLAGSTTTVALGQKAADRGQRRSATTERRRPRTATGVAAVPRQAPAPDPSRRRAVGAGSAAVGSGSVTRTDAAPPAPAKAASKSRAAGWLRRGPKSSAAEPASTGKSAIPRTSAATDGPAATGGPATTDRRAATDRPGAATGRAKATPPTAPTSPPPAQRRGPASTSSLPTAPAPTGPPPTAPPPVRPRSTAAPQPAATPPGSAGSAASAARPANSAGRSGSAATPPGSTGSGARGTGTPRPAASTPGSAAPRDVPRAPSYPSTVAPPPDSPPIVKINPPRAGHSASAGLGERAPQTSRNADSADAESTTQPTTARPNTAPPAKATPAKAAPPKAAPPKAAPPKAPPEKAAAPKATPAKAAPARATPGKAAPGSKSSSAAESGPAKGASTTATSAKSAPAKAAGQLPAKGAPAAEMVAPPKATPPKTAPSKAAPDGEQEPATAPLWVDDSDTAAPKIQETKRRGLRRFGRKSGPDEAGS